MAVVTQVTCDIENCADVAAFNNVETSVKSSTGLNTKKIDLCSKHKQQLLDSTPLVMDHNKVSFK